MIWTDLLFMHWRVSEVQLRPLVPASLPIDTFDGSAWVAVVPFQMSGTRPRGIPPIPGLSRFAELNVRTYVTLGGKPGVWFFSLDAENLLAVMAARTLFNLPYFHADMSRHTDDRDRVDYASRRTHKDAPAADFNGTYWPAARGSVSPPIPGSLEAFLVERYCLYTVDSAGRPSRLEIHHAPWPLQPAECEVRVNTMASAAGIPLPDEKPLLHFAKRLEVVSWLPFEA
jgi:uncharacterized protein YqjF (DUF2071 family)